MHVRLSFASILIFVASITFAQQPSQTSDRDKAGLRGPVKTVREEQTSSYANGPQTTTTTKKYAQDGRILEERIANADGPVWVKRYTYHPDGRLLKTVDSHPRKSTDDLETTYSYDDALRLIEVKSSDAGG